MTQLIIYTKNFLVLLTDSIDLSQYNVHKCSIENIESILNNIFHDKINNNAVSENYEMTSEEYKEYIIFILDKTYNNDFSYYGSNVA